MVILYSLLIGLFSFYSYALVDPNMTLVNHPLWTTFRNNMVTLGYYNRPLSWIFYLFLIIALYLAHFWLVKNYQKINVLKLALVIAIISLFSYPFLSHDFFNYLFDARIVTFYHQNPYFHKALDYPADHWLRFMHWTHRTYPYGPLWIVLTLAPSFLALGKFLLNFIFFKLMFAFFYVAATLYLGRLNKKWAVFFATSPLVIVEGLVNSHNDLIAVGFAMVGTFYLFNQADKFPFSLKKFLDTEQKVALFGRLHFLLSGLIKYTTLPILLLQKPSGKSQTTRLNILALIGTLILIGYISYSAEIQPWYFLNLLIFLPYFPRLITKLNIFFAGLLFSYYPYIYLGGWDTVDKIVIKHNIILTFGVINMLYLLMTLPRDRIFK